MAIPDYQTVMLPLLRFAGDGNEHKFRDAVEALALEYQLSAQERSELLPSGTAPVFDNRVGWARTYLKQAGLLESPKRGVFRITARGQSALSKSPSRIDVKYLDQFAEFTEFRTRRPEGNHVMVAEVPTAVVQQTLDIETPEDRLAAAYRRIRQDLELDLLGQVILDSVQIETNYPWPGRQAAQPPSIRCEPRQPRFELVDNTRKV